MSAKKSKANVRSPLEWTILATSIAAIAAVVVALITSSFRAGNGPPNIVVTIGAPAPASGGVRYDVLARNTGGEAAEDVTIEVTVANVSRSLTLATVAHGDQEQGVVVFPAGTSGTPTAAVQSYSVGG